MSNNLYLDDFKKIIKNINSTIQENAIYLSKLDSTIGDGDHGITIARGFRNVIEKIEKDKSQKISDLLKQVGLTLISSMGGASGPIFGSIFTEMAKTSEEKEEIDLYDLCNMFTSALNKISKLGGAKPGDKTLIDSLAPAVESLKNSLSRNLPLKKALANMKEASKNGLEATKNMIAKRGRSRYAGERSIGFQDAGATTMYLIIKAMYDSI